MTRFHALLLIAIILGAVSLLADQVLYACLVAAALLVAIGLGVSFPQLRLFGPYLCRGNVSHRCVALTFDDGPDEHSTPALLDLLKAEQVTAAFFCVGRQVAASPELARRIVNGGHLLENHSFGHSHFTNFFSLNRLKSELVQTQAAIQSATGTTARFFRPPMGLSNPRTFRAARDLGLKVIGWSARGLDTVTPDPEKVVARILRQVRPGTIILLHDGNIPAERLVLTMRLLLARLREREYEIVRLDQMLK